MTKRNSIIDFIKLVYAIPILLVHSNHLIQGAYDWKSTTIMPGGYIAVELFFIISGFLMAVSISKAPTVSADCLGSETAKYLARKIKIILPYYLVAFPLSFLVMHYQSSFSLHTFLKDFIYSFFPFFRVNITGLDGYDPIGQAWYISAMLLAMLALYPLMRAQKNIFTYFVAPLLTLFLYGYISKTRGNVSAATVWLGLVNVGVLRAIAGLSFGCICFEVSRKLKDMRLTKLARVILTLMEAVCYLLPLLIMQIRKYSRLDFILIFLFAVSVTISFSQQSYSCCVWRRSYSWVSELSLTIYLCQGSLIGFTNYLLPTYDLYQRLPYYLTFSIIAGLICMWCGNWLKLWHENHKAQIKRLFVKPTVEI